MKTFFTKFRNFESTVLILVMLILTFIGLNFKANAQSPALGVDMNNINNSMTIKMKNYEMDVLIPKVNKVDLVAFEEVRYNHMVYVTDQEPGFYLFFNNRWAKQKVSEVLTIIEMNLSINTIESDDIIIEASQNKQLLDYNSHINNLYDGFQFENGSNQLAIHLSK